MRKRGQGANQCKQTSSTHRAESVCFAQHREKRSAERARERNLQARALVSREGRDVFSPQGAEISKMRFNHRTALHSQRLLSLLIFQMTITVFHFPYYNAFTGKKIDCKGKTLESIIPSQLSFSQSQDKNPRISRYDLGNLGENPRRE